MVGDVHLTLVDADLADGYTARRDKAGGHDGWYACIGWGRHDDDLVVPGVCDVDASGTVNGHTRGGAKVASHHSLYASTGCDLHDTIITSVSDVHVA
jgi:hypothetical protein